jgi:hypothetical protein
MKNKKINYQKRIKNWVPYYDSECDHFYFTKKKISKDSRLHAINNDVHYYVNKKGEFEGIMIEYFTTEILKWIQKNKKIIKKI